MNVGTVECLDSALDDLAAGCFQQGMDTLFRGLTAIRSQGSPDAWRRCITVARGHTINAILREDPITRVCFDKPRGYAGDAGLLDLIYRTPQAARWVSEASSEGRAVYAYTSGSQTAQAVRERLSTLGALLDSCAPGARVLSVACGHFREGLESKALRAGELEEVIALDQDEESLAEIGRSLPTLAVRPVLSNLLPLLTGQHNLGTFDLVYAAGLYDYLEPKLARRLTARLFDLLRPSGRLWLANFLPQTAAIGYMEAFMDWHLTYRTSAELLDLARGLRPAEVSHAIVDTDRLGQIASLELTRRPT